VTGAAAGAPAGPPAVACNHLTYEFGPVRAVDDVTFSVVPGEVFGLIGPNGAGKTTTIRILTTLLRPAAGRHAIIRSLECLLSPNCFLMSAPDRKLFRPQIIL